MKNGLLDVVAVYSNPIRWDSRLRLMKEFERHMLESGVRLTTVECALGERPFDLEDNPHITRVQVRARTLVWNKENLINIGITRLKHDWKYLAWIDADVSFRKSNWASETVHALQQYPIVQPWSDCYDLGPNDDHLQHHKAFCHLHHHGKPIKPSGGDYQFAHPGYAWAARRSALDKLGGLLEIGGMGAGDHHMALGMIGRAAESLPGGIHPAYRAAVMQWQDRAQRHLSQYISYVPGTIEHAWHGSKNNRQYVSRWDILTKHNFDPMTDLKYNTFGVVELCGNKPALQRDIDRYFRSRNEDATTID